MIEPSLTPAWALPALVFVPMLGALVLWLLPRWQPLQRWLPAVLGLVLLPLMWPLGHAVAVDGAVTLALGGHRAPLGIEWYVDGLAVLLLGLNQTVAAAVGGYLWGAWPHAAQRHSPGFGVCWLLLWGALNALAMSADLFNIYVLLEIVSLGGVVLVVGRGAGAFAAAMRYLLFALTGSLIYLLGVALAYADAGTLSLRLLADAGLGAPAVTALTLGLMFKAALWPLHGWLPAAHAAAPTAASAVLSALVVKAAAYLLLRLWSDVFSGSWTPALLQALAVIGMTGVLFGSVQALRQVHLKRVIAYSTVAQLGYVLLLPALAGALAWQGVALHLLSHGLAKAAMFLAAGNVIIAIRDDRLDNLAGLDRVLSGNLFIFAAAGMSLAGMPPAAGFVAKWWLVRAAVDAGQWWWAIAVAASGLLAAGYVIRV
ncbi:MAG: proton-conducting transporter membrane subunit, partial [Pseudomonadales bacterium]